MTSMIMIISPPLSNWLKRDVRIGTNQGHLYHDDQADDHHESQHLNVHDHNDENLLRQILDQAWTGQEQPNAPAPALSNCNFNEGRKIFHVKRDGSIWKL